MYNKVFISYAKEDGEIAEKLYDFLVLYHYDPWLDKRKLLPGQQWDDEIKLALKKTDFIILLFSKTSVAKRGYLQREFKIALAYCEEKLDSDIFIIPIKIDDCEVPEKFKEFQWIDLQNPNSYGQILAALKRQMDIYISEDNKKTSLDEKADWVKGLGNVPDDKALKNRMEYYTPLNPNVIKPQYVVVSNNQHHIINLMNVDTKEFFPIWKHPKLLPYSEQIINFGLAPDVWEDGNGIVWINTLVFDVAPYDTIIDVHGAWNNGMRYSGVLHLDEDWFCSYEMAGKLKLFS